MEKDGMEKDIIKIMREKNDYIKMNYHKKF